MKQVTTIEKGGIYLVKEQVVGWGSPNDEDKKFIVQIYTTKNNNMFTVKDLYAYTNKWEKGNLILYKTTLTGFIYRRSLYKLDKGELKPLLFLDNI